ncbi:MAG: helix-turn-helix domain-containing protein [Candidatus Binatus sp.]|uniref:helix-turn-helix domain-containing protein n=1 Tax=Candidatus Binatus sp. TaxID=2811406 RepID=UPI00271F7ED4|nr:helix-turn-helix domain-containing protein [Candidatus Binatus sp.]MDO8432049.1 helix-turn-helix domain-containing protein [Candidatus Binatus sp.]
MAIVSRAQLRVADEPDASSRRSLFRQVGQSIGAAAADKLIADFGGRRLYIPMTPAVGDVVTGSIGLDAATAIARVFGGDRLLIPSSSHQTRRREHIVAMRAERISISRIARALRCTERYVYKVLASVRSGGGAPGVQGGT